MRISKLLSILLLLFICVGCAKYPADFWNQTVVAIKKVMQHLIKKNGI